MLHTLSGHSLSVTSTAVSRGGVNAGVLATCSLDRCVKVWSLADGAMLRSFVLPSAVNDVCISVDGQVVVAAGADGKAYRLSMADESASSSSSTYVGHKGPVLTCQLSADCRTLVTCCGGDGVRVWDVESRQSLRQLDGCFQRAQLSGARIITQSKVTRPMPELKPLQRVLASGSSAEERVGSLPCFVRRENPCKSSVDRQEEQEAVLKLAGERHSAGEENRKLTQRVRELEGLQKRWADATFSLCESLNKDAAASTPSTAAKADVDMEEEEESSEEEEESEEETDDEDIEAMLEAMSEGDEDDESEEEEEEEEDEDDEDSEEEEEDEEDEEQPPAPLPKKVVPVPAPKKQLQPSPPRASTPSLPKKQNKSPAPDASASKKRRRR